MPKFTLPFPLKGFDESVAVDQQPPQTSAYLNNVRPYDVQDERARGGQRPALRKLYTQQIGSGSYPVECMCQVTIVNT